MREEIHYAKRTFDKNFRFLFKLLALTKSFPHSVITKNFIWLKNRLKYIISNDTFFNIHRAQLFEYIIFV